MMTKRRVPAPGEEKSPCSWRREESLLLEKRRVPAPDEENILCS
jgi:hypothetical protein